MGRNLTLTLSFYLQAYKLNVNTNHSNTGSRFAMKKEGNKRRDVTTTRAHDQGPDPDNLGFDLEVTNARQSRHDLIVIEGEGEVEAPLAGDGAYEKLEELGRGGFGVVFKAKHLHTGRFVALKRIDAINLTNAAEVQASIQEIDFLRSLDHDCIVRCMDAWLDPRTKALMVAMAYAEGGSLQDLISKWKKKQELVLRSVWKIFLQVCCGLNYLHSR